MTRSRPPSNRSSSSPAASPCRLGSARSRARRSAFTLVELLVVVGIILLLMAILLPAISKAYSAAIRTRMAADLQTISSALEAYRSDFDQYPQVYTRGQGAYWLCRALIGPGDFNTDGAGPGNPATPNESPYGFRAKGGGKIWGPYLPPESIKMGDPSGRGITNNFVLLDRNRHPILYYPAKRGTDITKPDPNNPGYGGYLGPNGMFNPTDNDENFVTPGGVLSGDSVTGNMSATMFMILMGDGGYGDGSTTPTVPNGYIDAVSTTGYVGTETPAYTGNYVLLSPGIDEVFGVTGDQSQYPPKPEGPLFRPSPINPCDDVTNFVR